MEQPAGWKNYEDFSAGIDTNRLPSTAALTGRSWPLGFPSGGLLLRFQSGGALAWSHAGVSGAACYDAVEVAPRTWFVDAIFDSRPGEALTVILNDATRRALAVWQKVGDRRIEGQPRVEQRFEAGVLGSEGAAPGSVVPAPSRDLVGLRAFYRYSPRHLYEHVYLSSERYCWQCLVGEQRGHGDVDLATTYRFDQDQYVFAFREFLIPVASVFFYNMAELRSTGKFLGVTQAGVVENSKAGAFIRKASMTYYERDWEPA